MPGIAIVGMSCRYPDARSPTELWENVLAGRRAFRQIPPERLRLEDYASDDPSVPDTTYVKQAALIEGYEFDRVRFRVAGSTYREADMVHWLALEVAADALADAGFADGQNLPKESCGVLVGNSLTGEFSRANLMRLRWPYVRRVVAARLEESRLSPEEQETLLEQLERDYKAPFPPVGDDSLAGGLSNTIAGRISNHFDLKGGGFTVDGACASSLLAVANACSALTAGDLDVAVTGGVDLSLDPFELVGFAKLGALAADEMRVYDARSAGFWPGEGCGFVVLMREEEARRQERPIYAVIRGWGISSDGSGGITRPEVEGQLLALQRAYRKAGFGIETVGYFEGHGTGTGVGDPTELRTLTQALRDAGAVGSPAALGSIKANIGHTKAAAGVAGLIKATLAIKHQLLPTGTGWEEPQAVLLEQPPALRLLRQGEVWPDDRSLRAGVSAMGFGGINAHLVVEGTARQRRTKLATREQTLVGSARDTELFLLSGADRGELAAQVERLLSFGARLSRSDMIDLAAELARRLTPGPVRAALVADRSESLTDGLVKLKSWLADDVVDSLDTRSNVMLGAPTQPPRVGLLFTGQGSPANLDGGAWTRRFGFIRDLYEQANLPSESDGVATEVAQPAIVTSSLGGLQMLGRLGVEAVAAVGHSLGELTAYHWAGAFDAVALRRLATARGRAMSDHAHVEGAMASIAAGTPAVADLFQGEPVVLAGLNSPRQTVISGEVAAVNAVIARARAAGLTAVRLPVSHAFHSPLMADSIPALSAAIARERWQSLQRAVASTVTGQRLASDDDLGALLRKQMTSPVRFMDAVHTVAEQVDLWIEVGPGRVLGRLMRDLVDKPVFSLDAGGPALQSLLRMAGAAYVLGTDLKFETLFDDRFARPFDLEWRPKFFSNPCEQAPQTAAAPMRPEPHAAESTSTAAADITNSLPPDASVLDVVRQLAAARAELPVSAVKEEFRLLDDLHLSSLAVGQLVVEAARALGLSPPASPTDAANATVTEVAEMLEELTRGEAAVSAGEAFALPAGVDAWTRAFTVELVERELQPPVATDAATAVRWQVLAPPNHPLQDALRQGLDDPATGAAPARSESGVIVCLPPNPDERAVELLLEAARRVASEAPRGRFVLVQHGGGAAGFARSLHLERPQVTTCVVDVPAGHPQAADWVLAESRAAIGHGEAYYDKQGTRRERVLRLLSLDDQSESLPLDEGDVMLVTGGGKGIAAESALFLAKQTGLRLALLGRSHPADNDELAANLERLEAAGVRFEYLPVDVTDRDAVAEAVRRAEASLGDITAVLHGAGSNTPQRLETLDRQAFLQTVRPKVKGLENVLAAIDPQRLRMLVAFGSIIAETGMHGQADYAVANEWLAQAIERWQADHPHCRCLAMEWSVWSGVGMGERLGTVDSMRQQGITPITTDAGLRMLGRLLSLRLPVVPVVVTGRFGEPPTLKFDPVELPLLRFLERPRVHVPGVELVVEADLSADTDPYLADHVYQGQPLLPAVLGLEAMAQVAVGLTGSSMPPVFEQVKFEHPVVVPAGQRVTVRVAALAESSGRVAVVLRSDQTGFQMDHFRAACRFGSETKGSVGVPASAGLQQPKDLQEPKGRTPAGTSHHSQQDLAKPSAAALITAGNGAPIPLDPDHDLYGTILFQSGRFQRLQSYRRLRATECVAKIAAGQSTSWFSQYLPAQLLLGDPGARDAALHAVQACIPHGTLLPVGVERLVPGTSDGTWLLVHARERSQDGDDFVYDLELTGEHEEVIERWEGLQLRRVGELAVGDAWPAPLLGPYIERRVAELNAAHTVSVAVERSSATDRHAGSDLAIQHALGTKTSVNRRPDGKPAACCGREVSATHAGDLDVAVAGTGTIACDAEPIVHHPAELWHDLLGDERQALADRIAAETGEGRDAAATRVWVATECLKKAAAGSDTPLVFRSSTPDRWVLLAAGSLRVATWIGSVRETDGPLAVAVLSGPIA